MFGSQPYSTSDTSRDCWWLAFLTNGEGYHNFHHKFQADYRNGARWFQWDPTKWLIWTTSKVGLSRQLHRVPQEVIIKARIDAAMAKVESHMELLSAESRAALQKKLADTRRWLEQAMASWVQARSRYAELRHSVSKAPEEWTRTQNLLVGVRVEMRRAIAEWSRTARLSISSLDLQSI
jgi:stearoyl-CoA desaturase (delta-9 desaturase)